MANHSLDPEALAAAVARADKTPEESKKAGLSPTPDTEASTPDRPLDLEKVPVADAGDDQVRTIKGWKVRSAALANLTLPFAEFSSGSSF